MEAALLFFNTVFLLYKHFLYCCCHCPPIQHSRPKQHFCLVHHQHSEALFSSHPPTHLPISLSHPTLKMCTMSMQSLHDRLPPIPWARGPLHWGLLSWLQPAGPPYISSSLLLAFPCSVPSLYSLIAPPELPEFP